MCIFSGSHAVRRVIDEITLNTVLEGISNSFASKKVSLMRSLHFHFILIKLNEINFLVVFLTATLFEVHLRAKAA
jgi:hypothetical protein